MITSLIRVLLVLLASSNLASVYGQLQSEQNQPETKKREIGTVVSEIDKRIWRVFQDSNGIYWFGSNGNGIYKFDEKTLTQFTTKDGLAGDQIRGIQEDNKGTLYFETSRGISKYDGREFTTLKAIITPNNQWRLELNDLWFGYNSNDLYRFDGKSLYPLKLPRKDLKAAFGNEAEGNRPYTVYGINKDKDGNVWFGTESAGAFRYDGRAFLWFGEKELSVLPDGRVPGLRAILQDREGYFWLSNVYSKYKINPDLPKGYEKMKAADLPNEMAKDELLYFNSGIADDKGNLWMTTYGGGVWKYDGKKLSSLELKSGTEDVLLVCIYQDKTGRIWLGTDNDGVYKQSGESFVKFDPNQ